MSRERIISGIDIGSYKICTIIAQVVDDKISVIGVSSVPSKGIKKGVVVDIDEAVEAIAKSLESAERMAGYGVGRALVTVDGSHISSMNSKGVVAVTHPNGEITSDDVARATEVAQAVSIPSNQEIVHVLPRDYIVDSQDGVKDPIGMSGIKLEVETNIIYGAEAVMKNLTRCVQQVGVDVGDLVFSGIASSESVLNDTERELGTIVADIGGGTTAVTVFLNGSPSWSSVIPIGGQNITNDLAIGLRTSLENAERIKVRFSQDSLIKTSLPNGDAGDSEENLRDNSKDFLDISDLGIEAARIEKKLINEIVRARLSEIFSLIALEVKKSGMSGRLPGGIVITGGAAETAGLIDVAKMILKTPVRVGRPTGVTGLIEEVRGPAYASSIGLILYGSKTQIQKGGFSFSPKGKIGDILRRAGVIAKSFLP